MNFPSSFIALENQNQPWPKEGAKGLAQTLERKEPCGLLYSSRTIPSYPEGEGQEPVSDRQLPLQKPRNNGGARMTTVGPVCADPGQ